MKKTELTAAVLLAALTVSCHTLNVEKEYTKRSAELEEEKRLQAQAEDNLSKAKIEQEENSVTVAPVVVTEKQVVVYETEKSNEPMNLDAVKEAQKTSVIDYKDWIGANGVIDYDENMQIPVWTRLGSDTTIVFNDDEEVLGEGPMMSDTLKWEVEGQVWKTDKGSRQIITVKPLSAGLKTDMLILTDKRIYQFILYSTKTDYMPRVTFRYPKEKKFITATTLRAQINKTYSLSDIENPETVSMNYKIKWYGFFQKKPVWTPEFAYDDGEKTYIMLPKIVLQSKYPVPWEGSKKIVNYRTDHNLIIIDGLYKDITLIGDGRKVKVTKMKGEARVTEPDMSVMDDKKRQAEETKLREDIAEAMKASSDATLEYVIKWYGFYGNGRPSWTPQYVYDDGTNTYIVFPDEIKRIPEIYTDTDRKKVEKYALADKTLMIEGIHEQTELIEDKVKVILARKKSIQPARQNGDGAGAQ